MKRVFIVCSRPLLGHGLERLVGPQEGVEVVGQEKCLAPALPFIAELRPDAVIVAGDEGEDALARLTLRMLREGMCGRVIVLDALGNAIEVYWGERWDVGDVDDLLEAIRRV